MILCYPLLLTFTPPIARARADALRPLLPHRPAIGRTPPSRAQLSQLNEQGIAHLMVPYNWFAFANVWLFIWIEIRRIVLVKQLLDLVDQHQRDNDECAACLGSCCLR